MTILNSILRVNKLVFYLKLPFLFITEELTDVSQDGQEVLRELLRPPSCGNNRNIKRLADDKGCYGGAERV